MGAQLFHVGPFPMTPIKMVGIPLVAAAILPPRPRDAAPRPSAGILLLFAAFALFQVLGTTLSSLSFPATDASTLLSFAILMFATNLLISTRKQIAKDHSRDRAGRDVCEHVAVQAVLHLSLAAAAWSFGGSQLRGALIGDDGAAGDLAGRYEDAQFVEMGRAEFAPRFSHLRCSFRSRAAVCSR